MRSACLIIALILAGCVTGKQQRLATDGATTLTGWARVRGEVMVYKTRESMLAWDQANCVSGIPTRGSLENWLRFDGQRVTITGSIVKYDALPSEDTPILQRKILNGVVVSDFCLKDEVVSIKSITISR